MTSNKHLIRLISMEAAAQGYNLNTLLKDYGKGFQVFYFVAEGDYSREYNSINVLSYKTEHILNVKLYVFNGRYWHRGASALPKEMSLYQVRRWTETNECRGARLICFKKYPILLPDMWGLKALLRGDGFLC